MREWPSWWSGHSTIAATSRCGAATAPSWWGSSMIAAPRTSSSSEKQPRLVVSCGFSGGLDPALAPGDLVIATAVRDETGDELAAPQSVRQQALQALRGLRCFEGELVCTTSVAATEAEKLALARPGTLAVDMESHPAARAAAEAGGSPVPGPA